MNIQDFRLCGIGRGYGPFYMPTSQKVHASAQLITEETMTYNRSEIRKALSYLLENAQTILKAVEERTPLDVKGAFLDPDTVKKELDILSKDLLNVVDVVTQTWSTTAGKALWGTESKEDVGEDTIIDMQGHLIALSGIAVLIRLKEPWLTENLNYLFAVSSSKAV